MADNTASLVVALSAQLTKFEKDMRDAGIIADKTVRDIEDKFSKMNPSMFGASFLGNFFASAFDKAIGAIEQFVTEAIERFKKLRETAELTGLEMNEILGLQEGAKQFGLSADQINTGIKSVGLQLEQMKRGAPNELSKIIGLNPEIFGQTSDAARTLTQTLAGLAEVVKHIDDPVLKWDIARSVGLTEAWVKTLNQGGPAIAAMIQNMENAKPLFNELENQIKTIDKLFADAKEGAMNDFWKDYYNNVRGAIILSGYWNSALQAVLGWIPTIGDKLKEEGENIKALIAEMERVKVPTPRERPTAAGGAPDIPEAPPGFKSRVPSLAAEQSEANRKTFEREAYQIEKNTEVTEAHTRTIGQSVDVQERERVATLLTVAAKKQYGEVTDEVKAKIDAYADAAARAKLADTQRMDTLNKLNSASQQLGSALSTAFADAIVEGKALSDVMSSLLKTIEKAAINALIGNLFSPTAGATASPLARLFGFGGAAAGGTDFAPGGLTLVGERGPELVNLPRGSQVIPNDILRTGISGNSTIVYSPAIDARGASVEAVARLAQVVADNQQKFANDVVTVVRKARQGRSL